MSHPATWLKSGKPCFAWRLVTEPRVMTPMAAVRTICETRISHHQTASQPNKNVATSSAIKLFVVFNVGETTILVSPAAAVAVTEPPRSKNDTPIAASPTKLNPPARLASTNQPRSASNEEGCKSVPSRSWLT